MGLQVTHSATGDDVLAMNTLEWRVALHRVMCIKPMYALVITQESEQLKQLKCIGLFSFAAIYFLVVERKLSIT